MARPGVPPDPPGRATASRFALATALGLVCLALLAAGALGLGSRVFRHTDHRSHVVRGTVARVVVAADSGDVALRSGPAGRVTVAESRHYWWRKPKLELTLRDGVLTVGVDCRGFHPGCSNDLGITVPRGVGQASIVVNSGDVAVTGLDARRVDAISDSGDVDADDLAGALRLETDSGDVTARGLRGDRVTASTDSGDVDLALLAAPRALSARTESGDVTSTSRPSATASTPTPTAATSASRACCATTPRRAASRCAATRATSTSAAAERAYQCTPFIRFAIATCSTDAFSSGSFSPFAAAESGKTLKAMWRIWSTAFGASA
jgi:hypothetical protein